MHELSLSRAIADIVTRAAAGRPVSEIGLDVGALRQVVPETLTYCWGIVSRGGSLEGSQLQPNLIPGRLECGTCGAETVIGGDPVFRCGACDSTDCRVTAGEEFRVTYIDVADTDC